MTTEKNTTVMEDIRCSCAEMAEGLQKLAAYANDETIEPEPEVLTLDSIDELTLPGDMDPDEDQQSQRWRITDDGCADWALKKIKLEKDERDRIVALAEQEIARLKEQIEMVGAVAMIPDTGEIVEGIDFVEVPPAFSVKF